MDSKEIAQSIAYCGLVCKLCHLADTCAGCKSEKNCCGNRTSEQGCYQYECCRKKEYEGCWDCPEFPCGKGVFAESHDIRLVAFVQFIQFYGKEMLAEAILRNHLQGIRYGHNRDYDGLGSVENVITLLLSGNGCAIRVTKEDPGSADACLLMDELSDTLAVVVGDSGRSSFDSKDVCVPRALFAIARNQGGEAIGCGAIRPISESIAEVKRMYAKPNAMSVGSKILSYLEEQAQKLGYAYLRLETRIVNQRSVSFYESKGYYRISNYGKYVNNPAAVCFEKRLNNT